MSTLSGANDSPRIAPRQYGSCGITPATFMPPIRHTASAAEETEAAAITTPHAVSRMKNNIAAIAARPSPTATSGLPAVFFCGCARFAEPGGKRRRIAEPCGDLLLGVAVGHFERKVLPVLVNYTGRIGDLSFAQLIFKLRHYYCPPTAS